MAMVTDGSSNTYCPWREMHETPTTISQARTMATIGICIVASKTMFTVAAAAGMWRLAHWPPSGLPVSATYAGYGRRRFERPILAAPTPGHAISCYATAPCVPSVTRSIARSSAD